MAGNKNIFVLHQWHVCQRKFVNYICNNFLYPLDPKHL